MLAGRYDCRWQDYAVVGDSLGRDHQWRFLDLEVAGVGAPIDRPLHTANVGPLPSSYCCP
ncbi:hypothetical protein FB558_4700 [Pseudonocardia kunmingensis]|uniref:Uncharacterized protein n=1 Tax=Pseudonocardia kunmingensis TaxID=630975 RepID=A0A543DI25_9PSEU|nr:hypothetical protein FB558_4700 [Pseudonocardia kunmingensis]